MSGARPAACTAPPATAAPAVLCSSRAANGSTSNPSNQIIEMVEVDVVSQASCTGRRCWVLPPERYFCPPRLWVLPRSSFLLVCRRARASACSPRRRSPASPLARPARRSA